MSECGAGSAANDLLEELLADKAFPTIDLSDVDLDVEFPDFDTDLYNEIPSVKIEDLTSGTVEGDGVFDIMMRAMTAQLKSEYKAGRIVGAQYAEVFMGSLGSVLGNATQFVLQKDQTKWAAIAARAQAKVAEVSVVTSKVQLAQAQVQLLMTQYQAMLSEIEYAKGKIQLAVEDLNLCISRLQKEGLTIDNETKSYQLAQMLPLQRDLVKEQYEAQRAQTLSTRTDGAPVSGSMGKQNALYDQQITSYKRADESKVLKIFSDAWITMRTMDEGYPLPVAFNNNNLHNLLNTSAINVGLTSGLNA